MRVCIYHFLLIILFLFDNTFKFARLQYRTALSIICRTMTKEGQHLNEQCGVAETLNFFANVLLDGFAC